MPGEPGLPDFGKFSAELQSALINTTRAAAGIPNPSDLAYQRTLSRPIGKKVDHISNRLLHLTSRLLHLGKEQERQQIHGSPSTALNADLQEEDIIDGFQRNVVDVTDQLLESIDTNLDLSRRASTQHIHLSNQPALPRSAASGSAIAAPTASTSKLPPDVRHSLNTPKPQLRFSIPVDNSTSAVFRPLISDKPHAKVPLDLSAKLYYDSGIGVDRFRIPNPYEREIEDALQRPLPDTNDIGNDVLVSTDGRMENNMDEKPFTFVNTVDLLQNMLQHVQTEKIIAIDLEHHDFRSYRGLTCLMQLSSSKEDYIIDVLVPEVRDSMRSLNIVFASPSIVKVLHGAESDVIWLQRDLGLYLVNLFDTFHASQLLGRTTGHSLKSLLLQYTTFTPDKRYQLADWRIRPLSTEMLTYARSDTYFLIFIYQKLLESPLMTSRTIDLVRERSARTAQQVYEHVQFDPETGEGPGGWRSLLDKTGKSKLWGIDDYSESTREAGTQTWIDRKSIVAFEVFKALYRWRDNLARLHDESWKFLLSNKGLFSLCEMLPDNLNQLVKVLGNEYKGIVRDEGEPLLRIIAQAMLAGNARADALQAAPTKAPTDAQDQASSYLPISRQVPKAARTATASSLFANLQTEKSQNPTTEASYSTLFPTFGSSKGLANFTFTSILDKVHKDLIGRVSAGHLDAVPPRPAQTRMHGNRVKDELEENTHTLPSKAKNDASDETFLKSALTHDHKFQRSANYTDLSDDVVAVTGRRPKPSKKRKSTVTNESATSLENAATPFDYSQVKSILDSPAEAAAVPTNKKAKKEKGKKHGGYDEGFPTAPKSLNAPKHGSRSHTFV